MNEATSTIVFIAAEFGAVLLLLFVVALVLFLKRRASDKRYVAKFIAEHKDSHISRRDAMRENMASDSLLNEEELDDFLNSVASSERKLYKCILNMYLGFDRQCLSEIRDELSDMNGSWVETIKKNIQRIPEGSIPVEKVQELNDKIDELTSENEKIASDLAEAMETMEDIVKEYSLMYAGQENETMDRLSDDYQKLKNKSDSHNN